MRTYLNQEQLMRVNVKFTSYLYNKYSRQFPLMDQKRLAQKINQEWDSLTINKRYSLFQKYFPHQAQSKSNKKASKLSKKQVKKEKQQKYDQKYDKPDMMFQQDSNDQFDYQRVVRKIKRIFPQHQNIYANQNFQQEDYKNDQQSDDDSLQQKKLTGGKKTKIC